MAYFERVTASNPPLMRKAGINAYRALILRQPSTPSDQG